MNKHEQAVSLVAQYLTRHRYVPPEREGWYSSSEILYGIKKEELGKVRMGLLFPAIDFLHNTYPPSIEDIWMLAQPDGNPNVQLQFEHPHQPEQARRYYRALGGAAAHINLELVAGNINFAL